VDRFGNVVGMAAMTVNLDALEEAIPEVIPKDKPKKRSREENPPLSSSVQMIVKAQRSARGHSQKLWGPSDRSDSRRLVSIRSVRQCPGLGPGRCYSRMSSGKSWTIPTVKPGRHGPMLIVAELRITEFPF